VAPALPIGLLAWGALGTALHIGLANIGQSRFFCPLKGLVVLRSNISLEPNDIYARRIHIK
jgi:hypothetical protein